MTEHVRVLIVEDRPADVELMVHELRQAGFEPDWERVDTEPDYVAVLQTAADEGLDIILSDYTMPQFNAVEALHLLQARGLDIPFIVVTGSISEEVAVECMKQGAADYLLKDRLARLGQAVTHALQEKRLCAEKRRAEETLQESEEGKGSRFTVSLPWRTGSSQQYPVDSDQDSAIGEEGVLTTDSRSPITVLLAEDSEENIQTIADYLDVYGYRVVVARNGAEAIERVGEEAPDVILMDIQMPQMDGLEAIRRLRAGVTPEASTVPIIALTALAMPGDREQCLEAGVNEYLSKPVGFKSLVEAIEAQLQRTGKQ